MSMKYGIYNLVYLGHGAPPPGYFWRDRKGKVGLQKIKENQC